jgi:phosphatidylserine/phosphatidylglycerophosphate/cardiolipin synthase-like enzyme
MLSQYIFDLCRSSATVSSEHAKAPNIAPADVIKRLYQPNERAEVPRESPEPHRDDLELAFECGRWRERPSRLFLHAFADALACLNANPLAGMVSPPLMGSHGTVPLTILAPLADIARHCAQVIQEARREVFFVTCVWSPSDFQQSIKNALIELSKRAGDRGERVTVRVIYDQASPWHMFETHQKLKPEAYDNKHVQLPKPGEIPHLDLHVLSLHTVFLGTLHAKFCVVDGKTALIMSNNIEDNQNLEMLTHLEGPIVDSVYDTALITWSKTLDETSPPTQPADDEDTRLDEERHLRLARVIQEMNSRYEGESCLQATNHQMNLDYKTQIEPAGPEIPHGEEMTPHVWTQTQSTVPMALVSRPSYGGLDSGETNFPQNEAWLSLVRNAERSVFIQTPDLNAGPLVSALADALARGVEVTYYFCFGYNDAGEMIPGQGGTNEQAARKLIALAHARADPSKVNVDNLLRIHAYVAKDQDHPIHHSFPARACHLKLLIVDETVGVQGSGNQDTQSWCHSQELNVMIDSHEICGKWREAIERNQRTAMFGRVGGDGIWRDAQGQPGQGYSGDPGMVDGLFKGVAGMLNKTMRQRSSTT